jgi:TRAP-type C4-dicarboxylate transport system permease small subunit
MLPLALRFYAFTCWLNRAALALAGACFFAMLCVVMLQVVARYIFATPPFWTEELARWLMVWGGLLGATVAFHTRADPAMVSPSPDNLLRQRVQIISRFVAAWGFFVPVLYFCWPFLLRQVSRTSEGLEVSTAWMASALPVAALLICLHAFAGLLALFHPTILDREIALVRRATEMSTE